MQCGTKTGHEPGASNKPVSTFECTHWTNDRENYKLPFVRRRRGLYFAIQNIVFALTEGQSQADCLTFDFQCEGNYYICAATPNSILLLRYNSGIGTFCTRKVRSCPVFNFFRD